MQRVRLLQLQVTVGEVQGRGRSSAARGAQETGRETGRAAGRSCSLEDGCVESTGRNAARGLDEMPHRYATSSGGWGSADGRVFVATVFCLPPIGCLAVT